MKNFFKNKWFIGICIFLVLLIGTGAGVGNYFVNYALSPASDSAERNVDEEVTPTSDAESIIAENEKIEDAKGDVFAPTLSDAGITANDGIALKANYRTYEGSNKWVIIIHGYKSNKENMMAFGAEYYNRGYNVLLPDNRAHGESEGDYIGMGWLDKDDIALWVNWIAQQNSEAQIILHGVSMGGATTMMVSGMNLPSVVGYIEDCGYTSAWDIFVSELDARFSLPPFPIMHISNIVATLKAGYDFKDASALEQVKLCQQPMLFIHGDKDDFVPVDMIYQLYDAANCEKDIYIVNNAGHADAKNYDPNAYWNRIFGFIDEKIFE